MNKAVYIGAGLDMIPFIVLDEIKTFIYIDGLPTSEFGMFAWNDPEMYHHRFLTDLKQVMNQNNLSLMDPKHTYLEYGNFSDRKIKYYINTPFPEKVNLHLREQIVSADTLIIAGYDPHPDIIKMMPNLKHIVCDYHTYYGGEENDGTCRYLHETDKQYKYYLLKEKEEYEYWKNENMTPEIKNNFTVEEYSSIKEICEKKSF